MLQLYNCNFSCRSFDRIEFAERIYIYIYMYIYMPIAVRGLIQMVVMTELERRHSNTQFHCKRREKSIGNPPNNRVRVCVF